MRTNLRVAFPCFIPMHIVYTSYTIREQFGHRYAHTVWWFWNIIDIIDSFFPLFPYLLIHRTEEVADMNPARSTWLLPPVGISVLKCLYMGVYRVGVGDNNWNRVQRLFPWYWFVKLHWSQCNQIIYQLISRLASGTSSTWPLNWQRSGLSGF
jgi:tellurite resistance protein TehA-like permease